jgi:hypothetical protein
MNRVIGFTLATGIAFAAASACVENKGSLYVQAVMAPPAAMAGAACQYDPQPTSPMLNSGVMDVAFTGTYAPVLLMANQMVPRGSQAQLRVETSRVQIQGATVRLTDAGGAQIKAFTTLAAGFVDASNGTQPGYGAVQVIAIDPDTTTQVLIPALPQKYSTKRLVAYIKPYGQTLGGLHVEAGEFEFPITACNGCLVTFPPDAVDYTKPTPNCGLAGTGASQIAMPCFMGQDQYIDCRLCAPGCAP